MGNGVGALQSNSAAEAPVPPSKKEGWMEWGRRLLSSPFNCFQSSQRFGGMKKIVGGKEVNAYVCPYPPAAGSFVKQDPRVRDIKKEAEAAGRADDEGNSAPKANVRQRYATQVASALVKKDHDRAGHIFALLISTWNRSDSDVAPTYARSMVQDALKNHPAMRNERLQGSPIKAFGLIAALPSCAEKTQQDIEQKHFAELIKHHKPGPKSPNKIEQLKNEAEVQRASENDPDAMAPLISFYMAQVKSKLSEGKQDQACLIFEQLESPWRKSSSASATALETKMSAATALCDHAKNNIIPTLKASAADGNNDENACLRKKAIQDLERNERELAKAIAIVEDVYNRVVECRDNLGNDAKHNGLRGLIVERETLIKNAKEQRRAMLTILDSLAQQHIEQLGQLEEECKQNNKVSPTLFHFPFMEQLHYERFLLAEKRVAFAKKLNNIESK